MRTITLKTGAEYPVDRCGAADGVLWIGLPGMGTAEAARIFSDREATEEMVELDDFGQKHLWVGYTIPAALQQKDTGALVALRREDDGDAV